jgi:hypothetical protein
MKHAKTFKIRASAASKITGARGLGETGKTFVKQWLKEKQYKRRVGEFTSKYTNKGNTMEDSGIDLVARYLNVDFAIKNEEFYTSEYMQGTPDVVQPDEIWDLKTSWSLDTFPIYETDLKSQSLKSYYWQGQVYMLLTGRDNYKLCFTLQDTPLDLVHRDAMRYCYDKAIELTPEIEQEFIERHTYSNLHDHERVKIFEFERNNADIALIIERVQECREILKEIESNNKNIVKL